MSTKNMLKASGSPLNPFDSTTTTSTSNFNMSTTNMSAEIENETKFNYEQTSADIKTVCEELGFQYRDAGNDDNLKNATKYARYLRKWKADKKVILHKFVLTDSHKLITTKNPAHLIFKVNGNLKSIGIGPGKVSIAFIRKLLSGNFLLKCDIDDTPFVDATSDDYHNQDHGCLACGFGVCRHCMRKMTKQAVKNKGDSNEIRVNCPQCRKMMYYAQLETEQEKRMRELMELFPNARMYMV